MFATVETAPPDPILGLTEAFNADPNPQKINLSVGVYKDATGNTPVLPSVKEAERRILAEEKSKGYLAIPGSPAYGKLVRQMLFGEGHALVAGGRAVTAHTPGGTGALRIAADYLARVHGAPAIWLSEPTWPNHPAVFQAAGLEVKTYPYFDKTTNGVAFDAMIEALQKTPAGEVVLLHGCCHNPTGADLSTDQWTEVGRVLKQQQALPLVDFAYQGFADGLEEDAAGLRALCNEVDELLICSSFSKNFGLYNERVGALTAVAASKEAADAVFSQIKVVVRANYSNPPAHGSAIVAAILGDAGLRKQWIGELADMRDRINGMRKLFVQTLNDKGVDRDFSFIEKQRGMFSFSGLTKPQVERLRSEYAIYIVGSGRINVAGMTEDNMDRLCDAIKTVL